MATKVSSRKRTATSARQRAIQREIDAKPKKSKPGKKAVQAGTRRQPENPMPKQHLAKPGREADLRLQPRYLAPDYVGSGKLEGLAAIVTGGDSGIGRAVAVLYAREGADVAIVYLVDEHEDAEDTKQAVGSRRRPLRADPRRRPRQRRSAMRRSKRAVKAFGRLDILVNNAAFQLHADRSRTSPMRICRKPCRPTSPAISRWRARRCRT